MISSNENIRWSKVAFLEICIGVQIPLAVKKQLAIAIWTLENPVTNQFGMGKSRARALKKLLIPPSEVGWLCQLNKCAKFSPFNSHVLPNISPWRTVYLLPSGYPESLWEVHIGNRQMLLEGMHRGRSRGDAVVQLHLLWFPFHLKFKINCWQWQRHFYSGRPERGTWLHGSL